MRIVCIPLSFNRWQNQILHQKMLLRLQKYHSFIWSSITQRMSIPKHKLCLRAWFGVTNFVISAQVLGVVFLDDESLITWTKYKDFINLSLLGDFSYVCRMFSKIFYIWFQCKKIHNLISMKTCHNRFQQQIFHMYVGSFPNVLHLILIKPYYYLVPTESYHNLVPSIIFR